VGGVTFAPDPAAPRTIWIHWARLYALDAPLGDLRRPTRARLDEAMRGHVLAQATVMGTYEKRRR